MKVPRILPQEGAALRLSGENLFHLDRASEIMGSYSPQNAPLLGESTDSGTLPSTKETSPTEKQAVAVKYVESEDDGPVICEEVKKALTLAWPLILFNVAGFGILVITLMFVGHLGELELSSASIASSFASVTGFTVMLGLASTMETLCGQAYGAKNYHMLGVYLQAAWIVGFCVSVLVLILWMNMEAVLIAVGQDPVIAKMATQYLIYSVPGVFGAALLQPIVKYLQSQSVVLPLLVCVSLALVVHVINCHFIITVFDYGFTGGALATTLSYTFLLFFLVIYTWGSGKYKKTWPGFTWDSFRNVGHYLKIAIPSTFMLCLEYWTLEFLVLAAGLLPNPELQLSLLAISLNTTNLAFNIPIGLSAAVSTRVSNELGAYRPFAAKLAGKVVLGLSFCCAICLSTAMVVFRHVWGKAFSDVEEVIESVAALMPLIAVSAIFDGIQGVLSGIARGCGRQDMGAVINLTAFYIVGLPSALFLGFVMGMDARGLWLGLLLGQFTQALLLVILIGSLNWEKMAMAALRRVKAHEPLLPTAETTIASSSPASGIYNQFAS